MLLQNGLCLADMRNIVDAVKVQLCPTNVRNEHQVIRKR